MRKTLVTLTVVGLIWIGYTIWPLHDLFRLVRAIEARDLATVAQHMNFQALRTSLANQVVEAHLRQSRATASPLVQSAAAAAFAITDPVLARVVSLEAVAELLKAGWPVTITRELPPSHYGGITGSGMANVWHVFANSEYGIGRFEVLLPPTAPPEHQFGLGFRLTQWRWKLSNIKLPPRIQALLADELARAVKAR
jgi:hypothetical protein